MGINFQFLIDGMNAAESRKRAATQMTLGALIEALEAMPAEEDVANLCRSHSYRGYYTDLAFEKDGGFRTAAELLAECRAAMGKVFCGYKGGDYVMGALTPVWVANHGSCGERLMAVHAMGDIETDPEDDE